MWSLRCFLGIHNWVPYLTGTWDQVKCSRCQKVTTIKELLDE